MATCIFRRLRFSLYIDNALLLASAQRRTDVEDSLRRAALARRGAKTTANGDAGVHQAETKLLLAPEEKLVKEFL